MGDRKKLQLNSIIVKFLLIFLLFGSLLAMITVSIQNDLANTTTEELAAAQDTLSLTVLEKNLGEGDWAVRDHVLYKGDVPVGDGTQAHANIEPFLKTEDETDSFVYSFMDSALADENVLKACQAEGKTVTDLLRTAGSTLDADGNSIVGTFLDSAVCEPLLKNDVFSGDNSFLMIIKQLYRFKACICNFVIKYSSHFIVFLWMIYYSIICYHYLHFT